MTDERTGAAEEAVCETVWAPEKISWIDRVPRPVTMLLLLIAFLAVWQLVYFLQLVSHIILPSPFDTIAEIITVGLNLLTGDYMLKSLWTTTQEVLLGFMIAVVLGFSLGLLVGETDFGERMVMPYLVAVNAMPKVAFAPLFVSWLGFGIASKVALSAFVALFPIIVATAAGIHAADQNARMLFRTMGATRWQTLTRLKLPMGMPLFFTGLKNGAVLSVVGAVVGEFLGGGKGFGELIRIAASMINTPRVFALIMYLSLLGLSTFGVVIWLQRKLIFWHKETVTEDLFE